MKKKRKADAEEKKAERTKIVKQKAVNRTVMLLSNKVISRISPIQISLERDMAAAEYAQIPGMVKTRAKAASNSCKKFVEQAKDIISPPSVGLRWMG